METHRYGKSRWALQVAIVAILFAPVEARSDGPIFRPTRALSPRLPVPPQQAPTPVSEDPKRTPLPGKDSSTYRIGYNFGIASAVGLIGLTYTRPLSEYVLLESGVGVGGTGLQLSLMPKLTLGWSTRSRYIMGVGVSLSLGNSAEKGPEHDPHRRVVPWLNADLVGCEFRFDSGFALFFALGITMPMISYHWDFAELGNTELAWQPFPQMRLGIATWY